MEEVKDLDQISGGSKVGDWFAKLTPAQQTGVVTGLAAVSALTGAGIMYTTPKAIDYIKGIDKESVFTIKEKAGFTDDNYNKLKAEEKNMIVKQDNKYYDLTPAAKGTEGAMNWGALVAMGYKGTGPRRQKS